MVKNKLDYFKSHSFKTLDEFVIFWKPMYRYINEAKYWANINEHQFKQYHLNELFHWKNGMTMKGSGRKERAFKTKIIGRLKLINEYKRVRAVDLDKFNNTFLDVSPVWRIFLLHIINPKKFPIYDQHIHRTYNYVHNLDWISINTSISKKVKLDFYFKTYLPFISKLTFKDLKGLDEAFFAFGRFLNTHNQSNLLKKYSK